VLVLSRILVVVATLLLGGHVLRTGQILVVLAILGLLPLLGVRRRWAGRTISIVLWIGAAEWLRTLVFRVQDRVATGQPFGRLVVILGSVALFTVIAAALSQGGPLGRWWRQGGGDTDNTPGATEPA
jgi:hypothetical protein